MLVPVSYIVYLLISVAITIWVARTLHQNGRVFLIDAFHGNAELADSVNQLLVVGFYLVNLGFVTRALRTSYQIESVRAAIEIESVKIGSVLLILGGMHFFNILIFAKMRNRQTAPPPAVRFIPEVRA